MNKWFDFIHKIENGYWEVMNRVKGTYLSYNPRYIYDNNGNCVDKIYRGELVSRNRVLGGEYHYLYFGMLGVMISIWNQTTSKTLSYYLKYDEDE